MKTDDPNYDAIAIGGGPAGSCLGAVLGAYGHRVLVLEREKFPRYHIGESLIPLTFQPLERIGMIPRMKGSPEERTPRGGGDPRGPCGRRSFGGALRGLRRDRPAGC
jgi:2-polyprenyl-6-methoxyphenol hydroxylase-like FAD-dependent oxidoreductase